MFLFETKLFNYSLILILSVGTVFGPRRCHGADSGRDYFRTEHESRVFSIAGEKSSIENLSVEKKEEVSLATTLLLDFTLPGGGHFYRDDYVMGTSFLVLKITGAYMTYYFVKNWKEAEDSYENSRRAGLSADEMRNERQRYDRSAQYVTFSAAFNFLVFGISALINYNSVSTINERAFPSLNVFLSSARKPYEGFILNCGVRMRL